MRVSLKKALSLMLVLVMVLGIFPVTAMADEAQQASESQLPRSITGLSIAYPYNTETVKQTGSVPNRFNALTFESARGEVESAQMILSPNFAVTDFELTMGSLKNENGNIIPSWAFEVYVQHYVSISGAGNAPYWTKDKNGTYMFKPRGGQAGQGASGSFPDALIPQDAAITASENKISAGKNGGLWVNLNVQDAAPGTYSGYATLTVNGTKMQIPVSVRVYDVEVPEEVHVQSMFPVWWDQLQEAEGIDRNMADAYFDYLVSKRVMPMDAWNITRWDNEFVEYAASYLAVAPEISAYSLYFERNGDGSINETVLTATLTAMIEKNIALAQSGSNVDLFKKAYFALYDEPETTAEYKTANSMIAQLDKVKNALASKLDAYPELKASFLNLKSLITAQHPDDATYDKMWQDVGSTKLTGSYIYCPQFQYLNTASQRNYYANEEALWWYGCCFPTEPFPTYHINSPLIASRATGWMMYDYDIDGMLYSSVNYWGKYNNDGSITQLTYWTGYTDNGTPGDGMLVYPGSAYGVYGPIGTVRLENIRESFEDYEYLWLLENEYSISDISTYTKGLYEGAIVTGVYAGQTIDPDGDGNTDAVTIHHNNRIALLTKLEQLNIAKNGATEIAPGQEGFVRGDLVDTAGSPSIQLDEKVNAQAVTFDYKFVSGTKFGFVLMPDWNNFYGYFDFNANGAASTYNGVTAVPLDDGYVRVVIDLNKVTAVAGSPSRNIDFMWMNKNRGSAVIYLDNLQVLTEVPEIELPTEPPVTEPPVTEPPVTEPPATEPPVTEPPQQVFAGGEFKPGTTISLANTQEVTKMSFDYKITSGDTLNIGFLPNWSSYYGYFNMKATGITANGITSELLDDGYVRVFVDVAAITAKYNITSSVITMLYAHATWGNASGVIENIRLNESALQPSRGTPLTPGTNQNIMVSAKEEINTLYFDYKITSGEKFSVALMPNWSSYFGYYAFTATGAQTAYNGITTEALDDGYIRVTIKMSALTAKVGNPSAVIDFMFLNGGTSNAKGYIDNVQYTVGCSHSYNAVVTAPTCTQEGYTTYTCSSCGDSYVDNTVAALGHSYNAVVTAPTCTDAGYTTHTCANCGDSYVTDQVEALGHSYDEVVTAPSFSAGGYTTYTCSKCGHSYVGNETDAYSFDVLWNIGLADNIYANFHLTVDSRLSDVQIKVNGVVAESQFVDGKYVVSVNMAAAQMTDTITLQLVCGELESEVRTYSIRQYAQYILADDYQADNEHTKPLVEAMLHYGAAAQSYFNYNLDSLANADLDAMEALAIPEAEEGSAASGTVSGISYYGASLLFQNKIGVRFYFQVTGDIANYTFKDGAEATYKAGLYYVDVMNINPNEYDDAVEMTVTDDNATLTVSYAPMRYISRKYYDAASTDSLKNLVTAMYGYHKAAELYLDENDDVPEIVYRGEEFQAGVNKNIMLNNNKTLESITFEYKLTNDGYFHMALMKDWGNFYSYYKFDANGAAGSYAGVTTQVLEDGYILVTIDVAALNMVTGAPEGVVDFLYIRGDWTTANGYIDNVNYTVYEPKLVFEGGAFTKDMAIDFGNTLAVSRMTFDYKIESGTNFSIALLPDWNSYYGYFQFNADGAATTYAGIVTKKLDDGSVRVYVDLSKVTAAVSNPSNVVKILNLRWVNATGSISNICINEAAEYAPRGQLLTQKVGNNFVLKTNGVQNSAALTTLSFEYKIVSGERFGVALMPNWSSYFGYFNFNAAGSNVYNGVSYEHLEDGYIRVTFDLTKLTLAAGSPSTAISMLYVNPNYCLADVYIDNIQFS